jgi:hypothetical protein
MRMEMKLPRSGMNSSHTLTCLWEYWREGTSVDRWGGTSVEEVKAFGILNYTELILFKNNTEYLL